MGWITSRTFKNKVYNKLFFTIKCADMIKCGFMIEVGSGYSLHRETFHNGKPLLLFQSLCTFRQAGVSRLEGWHNAFCIMWVWLVLWDSTLDWD